MGIVLSVLFFLFQVFSNCCVVPYFPIATIPLRNSIVSKHCRLVCLETSTVPLSSRGKANSLQKVMHRPVYRLINNFNRFISWCAYVCERFYYYLIFSKQPLVLIKDGSPSNLLVTSISIKWGRTGSKLNHTANRSPVTW